MIWLLFESLAALSAVLGTLLFVLLVYWRRTGRPRPLLVGLGVAVVLLLVQALVVTQRERAAQALDRIAADLLRSRVDALAQSLATDFDAGGRDRTEFTGLVRAKLDQVSIRWLERTGLRVVESGRDRFTVAASYLAEVRADQYDGTFTSRWALTFIRTPDGWRIITIAPEALPWTEHPTWRHVEAAGP